MGKSKGWVNLFIKFSKKIVAIWMKGIVLI